MFDKFELKQRLEIRAKAFVSDPELVLDDDLSLAVTEAVEIGGEQTRLAVLSDIAFHRYLLLVERNGIDDDQLKAYQLALKQVTDPSAPNSSSKSNARVKPNGYL